MRTQTVMCAGYQPLDSGTLAKPTTKQPGDHRNDVEIPNLLAVHRTHPVGGIMKNALEADGDLVGSALLTSNTGWADHETLRANGFLTSAARYASDFFLVLEAVVSACLPTYNYGIFSRHELSAT